MVLIILLYIYCYFCSYSFITPRRSQCNISIDELFQDIFGRVFNIFFAVGSSNHFPIIPVIFTPEVLIFYDWFHLPFLKYHIYWLFRLLGIFRIPILTSKPNSFVHDRYLKEFRVEQCQLFLQHKCTQHRPFTCFHWHFLNQRRRRPKRKKDGIFNYSPDEYCTQYNETTGECPQRDE